MPGVQRKRYVFAKNQYVKRKKKMTYDEFEKIIIEDIIHTYPKYAEKLTRQYNSATVVGRDINSHGFYTRFEVKDKDAAIDESVKQLGENQWNLNDLKYGSDYILWIKNGLISCLEGFSYGEPWPKKIKFCEKQKKTVEES